MKSMTGYGRAEAVVEFGGGDSGDDGGSWCLAVELSGVNRKQTDVSVNLPTRLVAVESAVRKRLEAGISRGRITARVRMDAAGAVAECGAVASASRLVFDRSLAVQYLQALRSVAGDSAPEIGVGELLRAPGVFRLEDAMVAAEEVLPPLLKVVDEALNALVQMQLAEGENLRRDFERRLDSVEKIAGQIAGRGPSVVVDHRENLLERLRQADLEMGSLLDDERVLREIALFADRCDISEELTRIDSHLGQFRGYLSAACESGEAVGRPLDFLCQELNREFNTIGSKANDVEISQHVVGLKTELEKIREQVQNVQ